MRKVLSAAVAVICLLATVPAQAGWFDWLFKNTQSQTKHPIVLIPGIFAFDSIAGIDYWYKVPAALESQGAEVHIPKINSFESSAQRGESLINQLETIRIASRGRIKKFNLVGHSQGGMTARYVMNVRPDLVASVTTMHTPHLGSPVADVFTGIAPEGTLRGIGFEAFSNVVGNMINLLSGNRADDADIRNMLNEFNAPGAARFNRQFPAGMPGQYCGQGPASVRIGGYDIRLYSWSGTKTLTTGIDLSDAMFTTTGLAIREPSDGVTGRCSSHFGRVLKDDYMMNHIDVNNHLFGLTSLFETKPVTLFRNHANRLKNAGL